MAQVLIFAYEAADDCLGLRCSSGTDAHWDSRWPFAMFAGRIHLIGRLGGDKSSTPHDYFLTPAEVAQSIPTYISGRTIRSIMKYRCSNLRVVIGRLAGLVTSLSSLPRIISSTA